MAKKQTKAKAKGKAKAAPLPEGAEAPRMKPAAGVAQINEKQLRDLLKSDTRFKEELDEVTGNLRNAIKHAVDKQHLDKTAYAIVKKFYRMTPEKLAALWPVIMLYMDLSGLMERIDSVLQLPFDPPEQEEDAGDETQGGTAKPGPAFGGTAQRTATTVADLAKATGAQAQAD